jgi:ferredoxin-NADP reductase
MDNNALWFNKTDKDIFLEAELRKMLGDRLRLLITGESSTQHEHARIDKEYLKAHAKTFDQCFYVCGPDEMVEELSATLRELGVDAENVITEDLDS